MHDEYDDDGGASASFSCTFTYIFPRFCLARVALAIDANIDEHRTNQRSASACLDVAYFVCLRVSVCVGMCAPDCDWLRRRRNLRFFRDLMKFYKYFPTDNALLKKKNIAFVCMYECL